MEEKWVWVIYDPLYERVLCVHDTEDDTCEACGSREYSERKAYQLEEHRHKVHITMGPKK